MQEARLPFLVTLCCTDASCWACCKHACTYQAKLQISIPIITHWLHITDSISLVWLVSCSPPIRKTFLKMQLCFITLFQSGKWVEFNIELIQLFHQCKHFCLLDWMTSALLSLWAVLEVLLTLQTWWEWRREEGKSPSCWWNSLPCFPLAQFFSRIWPQVFCTLDLGPDSGKVAVKMNLPCVFLITKGKRGRKGVYWWSVWGCPLNFTFLGPYQSAASTE